MASLVTAAEEKGTEDIAVWFYATNWEDSFFGFQIKKQCNGVLYSVMKAYKKNKIIICYEVCIEKVAAFFKTRGQGTLSFLSDLTEAVFKPWICRPI